MKRLETMLFWVSMLALGAAAGCEPVDSAVDGNNLLADAGAVDGQGVPASLDHVTFVAGAARTPVISQVAPDSVVGMLVATVNAGGGARWVGATVKLASGQEKDLEVRRISGSQDVEVVWMVGRPFEEYRVTIWTKKVTNCGCGFCRRNGYHMEGRLDDTGWQTGAR